ncbi:Uncharacterised protein (plasmid) [Mycoplasmopsis gallopavonis]|uniref:Uncharacterized protein n=1 Tax=Mycoplasmopsis gallopavonis TaxID=76629 RepID=A0A449B0N4_9BACT|nr:hypothetical protein [Mycoplasmopsis gallopavonis]VEU73333.1 Uncharacterised protein [Mycoplasmopsis gallopavonis]
MAASFDFQHFYLQWKLTKVRVDNVEMDAFVFDSFLDFFEFFAVDYTKFTRVGVVEEQVAYNVDLDYANQIWF